MKEKKKQLIVVALAFALLLLIGGTYAYFSINATSDKTGAKVTGKANSLGNPTMQIKTSKLYLNLDANLMSQANAGKTYYANENESGLALETNPNYTLATAQLPEGDEALDCTYNYKVTATVTTPITDNSDSDVKVVVGDKTMTLKELTTAGTNGIIVSGEIKNLTKGNSVSIPLTSSVTNTSSTQDKLVGNSYTINIDPYTNGDTKAFSCKLHEPGPVLAQYLISSGNLWQSGLEGDGYRYIGSGAAGTDVNPDNFICFGITDKSECIANQDKYMYRVIGVFADDNGDNHVKLIKYKQLGTYGLNSFNDNSLLTNATYDYMQDSSWSNRIENWNFTSTNTLTTPSDGPNYNTLSPSQIYLHELNRNSNDISIGLWTLTNKKIGIMYVSDYALSLGETSIINSNNIDSNNDLFKTSWLHQSNNDTTKSNNEWSFTKESIHNGNLPFNYYFSDDGKLEALPFTASLAVRPVFYLTADDKVSSGDGSLENPFIIE